MHSSRSNRIREYWNENLCFYFAMILVFVSMVGCVQNKEEALKSRVRHGDVHAMFELGMANISSSGDGIVPNPNYRDAVHWFEEAANRGHTTSMYFLSQIGGQPEGRQAMWLKKGAQLGNSACVTELIKGYTHGVYGLPRDPIEAFHWVKIGWEMDFKERHFDTLRQSKEMTRLLANYRSNLRVTLQQNHLTKEEVERILVQIQ